jgi:signal transduction histidine kinase
MSLSRLRPTLFRISTKLTLAYSLVLILGCTLIFSYLFVQIRRAFVEQEQAELLEITDKITPLIQKDGVEKFEGSYSSTGVRFLQDAGILLMVVSPRAEATAMHEPPIPLKIDLENLKTEVVNQKEQRFAFVTEASRDFEPVIVVGATLADESRLILVRSTESFSEPLNGIRKMFWWMLIPMALIGFLGGLFLSSRTLIPVRELIVSMKKIESGSLSTRVPVTGNDDELEELKVLCNRMLNKIENLVNGLKEAFDHLAHDIRTPVTRLRGRAELALMAEGDVETYREALQSCFENSDKILSFLQVLTDITEAENRSRKLKLEKRYISELVREMMDLYEMAFEEKEIKVVQKLDTNDWALVDARLISRVIANLLDNAHKYTPNGGEVTIQTINETEHVILRVSDTGPGIAGEEHSMIWQKLYRSDKSRSEYGMGLGLTFVKAVVEAHDGKVSVRSPVKDGKGTEFEVLLQKMS